MGHRRFKQERYWKKLKTMKNYYISVSFQPLIYPAGTEVENSQVKREYILPE